MYSGLLITITLLLYVATHAFSFIVEKKKDQQKALRTMVWLTVISAAVSLLSISYDILKSVQAHLA